MSYKVTGWAAISGREGKEKREGGGFFARGRTGYGGPFGGREEMDFLLSNLGGIPRSGSGAGGDGEGER